MRWICACALLVAGGVQADTIHVPRDVATIQGAIDVAGFGDTIAVAPGTYRESLVLGGKGLLLVSDAGAAATTIDASGRGSSAVSIEGGQQDSVFIQGFTITGGSGGGELGETQGGGVRIIGASASLFDCVITGNSAAKGGGVYVGGPSAASIGACVIEGNSATMTGGGMHVENAFPYIFNTTFSGNSAANGGGGLACAGGGFPVFIQCDFEGNQTSGVGGGAYVTGTQVQIGFSSFKGNSAVHGGALGANDANLIMQLVSFTDNEASGIGGALNVSHSAVNAQDCAFEGNKATTGGAAFLYASESQVRSARFNDNAAASVGGAVSSLEGIVLYVNCEFSANDAGQQGGATHDISSNVFIDNCTMVGNSSAEGGAMFSHFAAAATVHNSILWDNAPDQIAVTDNNGVAPTVLYSLVQGGYDGEGNIDAAPAFLDQSAGNFRLVPGSAAADAGSNALVPQGLIFDIDGFSRFSNDLQAPDTGKGPGTIVDMGAHETQSSACGADLNGDGAANVLDFLVYQGLFQAGNAAADCDDDGELNVLDFICFQGLFQQGC